MTNIGARINSRKVALIYIYEYFFTKELSSKDIIFDEILKVQKDINFEPVTKEGMDEIKYEIKSYYDFANWQEDIDYIISNFFKKEVEQGAGIDMDYINTVVPNILIHFEQLEKVVNENTTSFSFKEMDIIDQAIFLLGYTESKELKTPKNILMNELIELAKRFGDESSKKLINGIGHKIID